MELEAAIRDGAATCCPAADDDGPDGDLRMIPAAIATKRSVPETQLAPLAIVVVGGMTMTLFLTPDSGALQLLRPPPAPSVAALEH